MHRNIVLFLTGNLDLNNSHTLLSALFQMLAAAWFIAHNWSGRHYVLKMICYSMRTYLLVKFEGYVNSIWNTCLATHQEEDTQMKKGQGRSASVFTIQIPLSFVSVWRYFSTCLEVFPFENFHLSDTQSLCVYWCDDPSVWLFVSFRFLFRLLLGFRVFPPSSFRCSLRLSSGQRHHRRRSIHISRPGFIRGWSTAEWFPNSQPLGDWGPVW